MSNILAIDPGTTASALVIWDEGKPALSFCQKIENKNVLFDLKYLIQAYGVNLVAIEKVESYGMPVGREVFETVLWCGVFTQAIRSADCFHVYHIPRKEVKLALCGSSRAKDGNIRQALLDLFGEPPTKKKHNPFYNSFKPSADTWQAWALAITVSQLKRQNNGKEKMRQWRFLPDHPM